jgi:hypothetical protein
MTARRIWEIRQQHGIVIAFRTPETGDGYSPDIALIAMPPNDDESTLSGEDVDALQAMTYEILAGRRTDPRLDVPDAAILCGFQWYSATEGKQVYCCLNDGHPAPFGPERLIYHVTSSGIAYEEVPF